MGNIGFGYYIFQDGLTFAKIRKIALECERLGFDSLWLKDNFSPWLHMWFKGQKVKPDADFLECWTTLSALAVITKRIQIGCVLVNLYREPSLVAKMASTLDSISQGRLELGLSAGWNKEECIAYGMAFPPKSTRREMLAEATKVIKKMWTEERASFSGKHYKLRGAVCWPKPAQRPRPALWIGGRADETLKIAARESDGWVYGLCKKERYIAAIRRLKEECKRVGRDWSTLAKAWSGVVIIDEQGSRTKGDEGEGKNRKNPTETAIIGTSEEVASELRTYLDYGVTNFIPTFAAGYTSERLRRLASKVMPLVR